FPRLLSHAPARGFRFPPVRARRPSPRCRGPAPAHPARREATQARRSPWPERRECSFFVLSVGKFLLKLGRLLADLQPIEERVRGLQPNTEPAGDLDFLRTLLGFNFVVTRDHLRTALSEPGDFQHPLHGGLLAVRTKLAHEFVQAHEDRKSTRLNSSHLVISYAVFCLKKKKKVLRYIL